MIISHHAGDGILADKNITKKRVKFERSIATDVAFEPGVTTIIDMKLKNKGTSYWKRYDLGIGDYDITISGNTVTATVHCLSSIDSKESTIALVNTDGDVVASASVPVLKAPVDFKPKTTQVSLSAPSGTDLSQCRVCIDPEQKGLEITRLNNSVFLHTNRVGFRKLPGVK